MGQKELGLFQEIQHKKYDKDISVDLTIYDVPASLLREFGEKIIRTSYPGGISEHAIPKPSSLAATINHYHPQAAPRKPSSFIV